MHEAAASFQRLAIRLTSRPLLALVLLGSVLSWAGISNHELWAPDELRVGEIGRAMWASGSWAVPRLNGAPFLEKPPLYWWTQASLFSVFGRADATLARSASALFGLATLLLLYALGRRYLSPRACLLGALVGGTTNGVLQPMHAVMVDSALVFGVVGTFAFFAHALDASGSRRGWLLAGMYACLGAAFFAKGVVGAALPALGILVYLLVTRSLRRFVGRHLVVGPLVLAVLVATWLARVWSGAGFGAVRDFVVVNQLGRSIPSLVQSGPIGHQKPVWYYLLQLPVTMLPWTPFVLLAFVSAWRNWQQIGERRRDLVTLCAAATLPAFVLLSAAGTKRSLYLAPLLPLPGLVVGGWMTDGVRRMRWERLLEDGWAVCLLAAAAAGTALVFADLSRWVSTAGLALLIDGVALAGLRTLRDGRESARGERLVLATIGFSLVASLWLVSVNARHDRERSLLPFIADVKSRFPAHESVRSYLPSEALMGAVGFYLQRRVEEVDAAQLAALAAGAQPVAIALEDAPYREVRARGLAARVVSQHTVGDRIMRIVEVGGSPMASACPGDVLATTARHSQYALRKSAPDCSTSGRSSSGASTE